MYGKILVSRWWLVFVGDSFRTLNTPLPLARLSKGLPWRLTSPPRLIPVSVLFLPSLRPCLPRNLLTFLHSLFPAPFSEAKSLESASANLRLTIRVIIQMLCTLICFMNVSFCLLPRPWEHQQTGCGGNKRVVLRRQVLSEAFGWTRGQVHEVISFCS